MIATLKDPTFWRGLLLPFSVGALALWFGGLVPTLGAPVVGILLGLIIGQVIGQPASIARGTTFCAKTVLQTSIVLLGAGMSLIEVGRIGLSGLPVLLGTLLVAVGVGLPLSRKMGIDHDTGTLVVYGTSICGASAIATMSQVIGAEASAVAVSVAVIVFYNVLAAIFFPYLGQLMHMTPQHFGLWAGTAVNDTSSVVAAATSYDALIGAAGVAAAYAVVVKLTRTLMIIPLSMFEAHRTKKYKPEVTSKPWYKLIPTFLILFLVAAGVRTLGLIPDAVLPTLSFLAKYGITVAMTAVGMSSSFAAIRKAGWRPLLLGALLWAIVACSSLLLQHLTGQM